MTKILFDPNVCAYSKSENAVDVAQRKHELHTGTELMGTWTVVNYSGPSGGKRNQIRANHHLNRRQTKLGLPTLVLTEKEGKTWKHRGCISNFFFESPKGRKVVFLQISIKKKLLHAAFLESLQYESIFKKNKQYLDKPTRSNRDQFFQLSYWFNN